MKKFQLHLDAVITLILVFALTLSVILFQRYQYSKLLQDNIDLAWDNENLTVNLDYTSTLLDRCKTNNVSETKNNGEEKISKPAE
ncbi:hypothetical protein ACFL1V_04460 [Pseudomonadota bacterium]